MPSQNITLFDLAGKTRTPFSPWVWPIRMLLNYKGLPHTTTPLCFVDIGPVLAAAGAPPTRTTAPQYTVPAIIDGETVIADSRVIAEYLERTYPTPAVPLQGSAEQRAILEHVTTHLRPLAVPGVLNLLDERDKAYFVQSRREMLGMELDKLCPLDRREEFLSRLEDGLNKLSDIVGEPSPAGWVFGNDGPAYTDFELVGMFLWVKAAGLPDVWERVAKLNGGKWSGLLAAAEPYMKIV
ncbi:glutathione S-transferase [Mycena epipterygia]|nr:glutathione S-transferase [Mycena epipterygia]